MVNVVQREGNKKMNKLQAVAWLCVGGYFVARFFIIYCAIITFTVRYNIEWTLIDNLAIFLFLEFILTPMLIKGKKNG